MSRNDPITSINTKAFNLIAFAPPRNCTTTYFAWTNHAIQGAAMQLPKPTISAVLIVALLAFIPRQAQAQDAPPTTNPATPDSANPGIVRGQPFSAIRYVRKVKTLPDGKQQFLRNHRYPVQLARDSEGRIHVQSVEPKPECDRPELLKPPVCSIWSVLIFDPAARKVTAWPEGEIAAHVSVVLRLSDQQVEDAENSTTTLPVYTPVSNWDGASFTTKDLGEKVIEGIRATGVRTTKEIPAGHFGNKDPIVTIHEVWTSPAMKLIVKIIDGDPRGEETISGLEHVSFAPDPALFQSPDGYEVQEHWNTDKTLKTVSKIVDDYIRDITAWFPSQTATEPEH
jgi:hypothetical protein